MPEFASYPPGTPCWVDLGSPDTDASAAFYGSLFGWTREVIPEAGGYGILSLNGKTVGGLGPLMGEGQPPSWSTYVCVDDVDKTAEAVAGAGGRVLAPPMDVMTAGRMAVFMDPTGAAFSSWQPGETKGAELANEPGAFCWNELNTRDVPAASAFYPAVFGWTVKTSDPEAGMQYYEFERDGQSIAGMMPMPDMVPAEVPAHWLTYFAVADTDASVARVQELGGTLLAGPIDIPAGRFAVVAGKHGEAFGIIKM